MFLLTSYYLYMVVAIKVDNFSHGFEALHESLRKNEDQLEKMYHFFLTLIFF